MSQENKYVRIKEIPEGKIKVLEELEELIKKKRTFMIASIKNLPAKQFQEIKKKLKGKAEIKILKKSLVEKVIKKIEKGRIKEMKKYVGDSCALLFSDLDAFELSAELSECKSPAKAKAGQISEQDIIIEAGPTELVPGPAISEFGAAGIKIAVENGKIVVKENKVLVKAGDKILERHVAVLAKLDVMPFSVSLEPLAAYDSKEEEVYSEIKVDKDKTLEELSREYSKALAFAVSIGYESKETISFLLAKANIEGQALSSLIKNESSGGRNE